VTEHDRLIEAALAARRADDLRGWDAATAMLAADASSGATLTADLARAVRQAGERGWQPDDLRRHLVRFHSPAHAALLDAWPATDRLAAVDAALTVLDVLARLPRIARLTRTPHADHPALARIRSLLAKAESTEFPAEAEALVARAQQLMTRHSLDAAALAAPGDAPTGVRLAVEGPYEEAKATLLHVIADANRCRSVWHAELGFATVLGFPADLDGVELLYTSLLLQADRAMPKNGSRKRFRHSFLTSFAHHIGERLARAGDEVITDDLLPVLAVRDQAVDTAVERLFPQLTTVRSRRIQDLDGWNEGRRAADDAELG
jgi:uncharacterized protein DUF2786